MEEQGIPAPLEPGPAWGTSSGRTQFASLLEDVDVETLPEAVSRDEYIEALRHSRQMANFLVGLCNNAINSGHRELLHRVQGLYEWYDAYRREYMQHYYTEGRFRQGYVGRSPMRGPRHMNAYAESVSYIGTRKGKNLSEARIVAQILDRLTAAERELLINYFA